MNNIKLNIIIILSIFFLSCEEGIKDEESFYNYLENQENGLVKTKNANNISIKLKYIPPELLAYKDYKYNKKQLNLDSLIQIYSKQITFLMTISPDKNKKGDIMFKDVYEYKDYKQKVYNLNFKIEQNIILKCGEKEYLPVLSSFESVYGIKESRDITFVFSPNNENDDEIFKSDELIFEFNDRYFGTGINKFKIKRKNIEELNKYKLNKILK